jgi:hypothetical protein
MTPTQRSVHTDIHEPPSGIDRNEDRVKSDLGQACDGTCFLDQETRSLTAEVLAS